MSPDDVGGCVPLISVVTPVYNGSRYLDALIESVRGQSHPRVEHIVIDDGSDDGGATVAVLGRHPHLRWWTRPNRGQYATLNEGMAAARGDWVCVVSADDVLASPTAFADLLAGSHGPDSEDAVFGRTVLMDADGRPMPADQGRPDESSPLWLNFYYLVIHHCSMLVSRRFVEEQSLDFDTTLRYTGDWDWIIRILKSGRARFVDVTVSRYRVHVQQTRQTTARRALEAEDRLVLARHGSSHVVRSAVLNWLRLRKLVRIATAQGGAEAWAATARFIRGK